MSRPIPVVAGLIERAGLLLLAQRGSGPRAGLWEFPGGKVEDAETPAEALHRELAEELGIATQIGREVVSVTHAYPDLTIRLSAMEVIVLGGQPNPREHKQIAWTSIPISPEYHLSAADTLLLPAVERWLRERGSE